MKIYVLLLIFSQFSCMHSLILRRVGHHGLRRIDRFTRPVQIPKLSRRNLGVQRSFAPSQALALGRYDYMCQMCKEIADRYGLPSYVCSRYCSHPYIPPSMFNAGLTYVTDN